MILPVFAIIGRPNVGKSTLFNVLTQSRDALVIDLPGVTRDRQFGQGRLGSIPYIVIDTGGIGEETFDLDTEMSLQSWKAVEEAEEVLFLVDGRAGLTAGDETIAARLRRLGKKIHLVVNKTDGLDPDVACSDFAKLQISTEPFAIAASHGRGVRQMVEKLLAPYEQAVQEALEADKIDDRVGVEAQSADSLPKRPIRITVVGSPNVGKSTLINRFLGEERVVVFDEPGTTRDSIAIDFERRGVPYILVDTAGVRRNKSAMDIVEKFSVVKTLQAVEASQVVILVLDGRQGLLDQDLSLLSYVLETGKALVLAVNKWDGLEEEHKQDVKATLSRRLNFVDYIETFFISAKYGTNVGLLWEAIGAAHRSATKPLPTPLLTRILQMALEGHQPPLVRGRRIKLRYAHCGGHNPPIIVLHGNQTEDIPAHYLKYLENYYRKSLEMIGTPLVIRAKTSDNPYAGKRNPLTPRQQYKRDRVVSHRKKKKA